MALTASIVMLLIVDISDQLRPSSLGTTRCPVLQEELSSIFNVVSPVRLVPDPLPFLPSAIDSWYSCL